LIFIITLHATEAPGNTKHRAIPTYQ